MKIKVPCKLESLREVRNRALEFMAGEEISHAQAKMIATAIDEICANIIIHANKQDPNKFLQVSMSRLDGMIMIEAMDEGHFFNIGGYQTPDMRDLIEGRKKGGMGLLLVQKIMDRVEYQRRDQMNVFRLMKRV